MATETKPDTGTWALKTGLAQMLKGGVIMDVVTPEQAKIAENAGAVAVMALERVPSDIRKMGGVARMSDPQMIAEINPLHKLDFLQKHLPRVPEHTFRSEVFFEFMQTSQKRRRLH